MRENSDDSLIAIARITGVFGIKGDLKVSSSDLDVIKPGAILTVRPDKGAEHRFRVTVARLHRKGIVAHLEGVEDVDAAASLTGAQLLTSREELPELPEATYRDADLLDMQVRDAIIGELGTVRAVQHYPSCDMLVVGDKPWLIPLLAAYEVRVDQAAREIHVRLPAGFEEL